MVDSLRVYPNEPKAIDAAARISALALE